MHDANDLELLAPRPAAKYLGVTHWALARWRQRGQGPDFIKLGGRVRYRRSALDAFLQAAEVRHGPPGRRSEPPSE